MSKAILNHTLTRRAMSRVIPVKTSPLKPMGVGVAGVKGARLTIQPVKGLKK